MTAITRNYLPYDLDFDKWEALEPWFEQLLNREINSSDDLKQWLKDNSELESAVAENMAWRYIRMTIDTRDEERSKAYQHFIKEISPKIAPYSDKLNKKLAGSAIAEELKAEQAFGIYLRKVEKEIQMFREENIPLMSELAAEAQKFGEISGGLSIELDGEKMTMQRASKELQKTDRTHREKAYKLVLEARTGVVDDLDNLFSSLIAKRHQVALNAGYKNYRDYKFDALGRFDYKPQDCYDFHQSIKEEIVPLSNALHVERKKALGYDSLKPWDVAVDVEGKAPLKPFNDVDELLDKSVSIFNKIDPFFGNCLKEMNEGGFLDLASKEGKAPGGYNYPLYESGIPFIFMNAVGTPRDLVTLMHEGGHAIHSFLTADLELASFKSCPSEVAELASMAMELISMDYWSEFYTDSEDLKRAKKEHLEDILATLPWIAVIDKYQHWLYENPNHSIEERKATWLDIIGEFGSNVVDWSGVEKGLEYAWQKQLHLFEVPFYYIEYGMAQLGAIAVWRNYKKNPELAVQQYKDALSLGYTKSIADIYAAAGIEFNFSSEYIKELANFVKLELETI